MALDQLTIALWCSALGRAEQDEHAAELQANATRETLALVRLLKDNEANRRFEEQRLNKKREVDLMASSAH